MASRWFFSFLTVLALLFGGLHSAAMAVEMARAPVMTVSAGSPCHMALAADEKTPIKQAPAKQAPAKEALAKPDCCTDACMAVAVLLALPAVERIRFERVPMAFPLTAAAPSAGRTADERPPKTLA